MNKELRLELDEIHEDLEMLRKLVDEVAHITATMDKLGDVIIPMIPAKHAVPIIGALEHFFAEWEFTRHPRDCMMGKALQAWLDSFESIARVHHPEELVALRRSGLHDVIGSQREFDAALQRQLDKLRADRAPVEPAPDEPGAKSTLQTDEPDNQKD